MVPSCCIICLMCTGHLITTTHDKLFRKNSCFHHVYICHNTEFMVLPIIIAQQNSCHGTVNSMRKIMVKQSINSPSLDADTIILSRYLSLKLDILNMLINVFCFIPNILHVYELLKYQIIVEYKRFF